VNAFIWGVEISGSRFELELGGYIRNLLQGQ
jgi:hypothetical protein